MKLSLRKDIEKIIFEHASETYPNECCGFLFGQDREGDIREIGEAVPVRNSRDGAQQQRFEILPEDYMKAEQYARDHQVSFIGIYHSHPDHPAIPSDYDLQHALPFFSYIIISLSKEKMLDFRSWILDEDFKFTEEEIQINTINS